MAGEIFVQLIVDFADDEKVRALSRYGRAARGCRDLYVQMICYCKRKLTDGFVPLEQVGVLVYPDPPKAGLQDVRRLVEVGLLEDRPGGFYLPGYLKRNASRDAVEAGLAAKAAGAVLANHRRWHAGQDGWKADCPHCTNPGPPQSSDQSTDRGTDDQLTSHLSPSESTETETETETEELPSPPRAVRGSDDDPQFAAFWSVYPRKTDKGHARKAWRAAMSRRVDPQAVIAAAERYRNDPTRRAKAIEFTAYPATWLNGERYDDTPPEQAEQAGGWWNN